jgi:hypothetical protein
MEEIYLLKIDILQTVKLIQRSHTKYQNYWVKRNFGRLRIVKSAHGSWWVLFVTDQRHAAVNASLPRKNTPVVDASVSKRLGRSDALFVTPSPHPDKNCLVVDQNIMYLPCVSFKHVPRGKYVGAYSWKLMTIKILMMKKTKLQLKKITIN